MFSLNLKRGGDVKYGKDSVKNKQKKKTHGLTAWPRNPPPPAVPSIKLATTTDT